MTDSNALNYDFTMDKYIIQNKFFGVSLIMTLYNAFYKMINLNDYLYIEYPLSSTFQVWRIILYALSRVYLKVSSNLNKI